MFVSLKINNNIRRALLFLLLLFHESFTCGWHKGPWFNRPRRDVKASLSNYSQEITNSIENHTFVADEQNVKNEANIKTAIDRLREILLTDDKEKKSVDPKVMKYLTEQRDSGLHSLFSERNASTRDPPKEACTVLVSNEIPRSSDQFTTTHFVINIPDFQQTVKVYKCTNLGKSCSVDYDVTQPNTNPATCKQTLRYVKVLMLPNTKQYFSMNDFKVTTLGVEDGCLCTKTQVK